MKWLRKLTWVQIAAYLAAIIPFAVLVFDYYTNNLTINPIQEVTHRTGRLAMYLLLASLAITPLITITGYRGLAKAKRPLGLQAYFYAVLHFVVFIGWDYGFQWQYVGPEIIRLRYTLIGGASLLIMAALALTSSKDWQKRMKKAWKRLHKLAYFAGIFAVLHYVWVQKSIQLEQYIFLGLVALLLVLRITPLRKGIVNFRQKVFN